MVCKEAVRDFYLAVFAVFTASASATSSSALYASPDVCALEPKAKVSDACASYADLDRLNNVLHPYVSSLTKKTDFFSYYRLNLYNKVCPFWNDESGACGNIACAVTTVENEEDVPPIWRAESLSRLEGPKAHHPGRQAQKERQRPLMGELGDNVGESCVVEYDDECDERDYCVPEDESASVKGDYVSLVDNPERFTGYSGDGAHQVWEAIYRENCFSKPASGQQYSSGLSGAPLSQLGGMLSNQAQAAMDFKNIMRAHDRKHALEAGLSEDQLELEDDCLEKRVFYRVISGMHASISVHLCHDYLNQTTGRWGPNLQCYKERLHEHPERISNLYFNYAFVLRAVGKLRDYVQDYTFCTGDSIEDGKTKRMIAILASAIPPGPQIFDESIMFKDNSDATMDGASLKEDFRNRFRNVSRIMDCVGCDKCRLWGKLQTAGFGTALKVLFEFGDEDKSNGSPLLRRTELVALINTLDKISAAMKALEDFRGMLAAEEASIAPKAGVKSITESGFSDLDDLDDFEDNGRRPEPVYTLKDEFWEEYDRVWKAFKYVIGSWISFPVKVSTILSIEVSRLWDWWLGLPMRPRSWEFKFPRLEEL